MNCKKCQIKLKEATLETKDNKTQDLLYCKGCNTYYALGEFDSTLLKQPFPVSDAAEE